MAVTLICFRIKTDEKSQIILLTYGCKSLYDGHLALTLVNRVFVFLSLLSWLFIQTGMCLPGFCTSEESYVGLVSLTRASLHTP